MTLRLSARLAALTSIWLALAGLVLLGMHLAVVEVLCLEVAAVALAIVALGWHLADTRRDCGHDINCTDTRGTR